MRHTAQEQAKLYFDCYGYDHGISISTQMLRLHRNDFDECNYWSRVIDELETLNNTK